MQEVIQKSHMQREVIHSSGDSLGQILPQWKLDGSLPKNTKSCVRWRRDVDSKGTSMMDHKLVQSLDIWAAVLHLMNLLSMLSETWG